MAADFERRVYCILGVPLDAIDLQRATLKVRAAAARRERLFVSTVNLNYIVAAQSDTEFRNSVVQSDLSLADGMPLVWVARLLGVPIRKRVAGSNLFEALRAEDKQRLSVYFFGGPPGVAELAHHRLNAEQSAVCAVGYEYPGFGSVEQMSSDGTIGRINECNPDFLLLSLGAKKGQEWIMRNRACLTAPIVSHLGAVVNFVAGTVRRSPRLAQSCGLEWLWRIWEEPRLWRRYLPEGLVFLQLLIGKVIPHAWHVLWYRPDSVELARASVRILIADGVSTIFLGGSWTDGNIGRLREVFAQAAQSQKMVVLDLRSVVYVDVAFLGLLQLLCGHLEQHGARLHIRAPQPHVRRVFELSCTQYMLE